MNSEDLVFVCMHVCMYDSGTGANRVPLSCSAARVGRIPECSKSCDIRRLRARDVSHEYRAPYREPVMSDGVAHTMPQPGACMDASTKRVATERSPLRYKVLVSKLEVRIDTRLACYLSGP